MEASKTASVTTRRTLPSKASLCKAADYHLVSRFIALR
jgi:hypothetical protein